MVHGQHSRNRNDVGIDLTRSDHRHVLDPGQYAREAGRAPCRDLDPSDLGERADRDDGVAHDPSFLRDGLRRGVLVVRGGVHDDVVQHRVGRAGIRARVRVPREPVKADLCRLVDVVLSAVREKELSGDVLDVFGAVDELEGEEPQVDDVVRHDAQMLGQRPGRFGRGRRGHVGPVVQAEVLQRDAKHELEVRLGEVGVQVRERADDGEKIDDVDGHARVGHDLRQLGQDARQETLQRVRELERGERERLQARLDRRRLAVKPGDEDLHENVLPRRLEAPAVADEDGERVVCEALRVARLQARRPARDARSQLALRDLAAEREQELRDGRAGLGPAEKVLVREERREVAEHVRQDLPVLFFAHDVDDREQEQRDGQHDAVSGPVRIV